MITASIANDNISPGDVIVTSPSAVEVIAKYLRSFSLESCTNAAVISEINK